MQFSSGHTILLNTDSSHYSKVMSAKRSVSADHISYMVIYSGFPTIFIDNMSRSFKYISMTFYDLQVHKIAYLTPQVGNLFHYFSYRLVRLCQVETVSSFRNSHNKFALQNFQRSLSPMNFQRFPWPWEPGCFSMIFISNELSKIFSIFQKRQLVVKVLFSVANIWNEISGRLTSHLMSVFPAVC